jgi:hypothetical protein
MSKSDHQVVFYSILILALLSILIVPGGFVAQASSPLAPTAPGHNIYFQAAGLPDGVTFSITGTRVNNGSHPASYTTSFTTPNLSPAINADPGTEFTYNGFPPSIDFNGQYYELISLTPVSPLTVGVSGGSTTILATYEAACQPPTIMGDLIDQTVQYSDPVTFTLTVQGSAPLSYEWYKDNNLIPAADQSDYTISSTVMEDAGLYHAVVSNACGTDTSSQVQLTIEKLDQTITFDPPPSQMEYGSTFWVTPTASSGLLVSLSAVGSCTNSGFQVSMVSGTGDCVLTASQAGNDIYNPAIEVDHIMVATKADQTIAFTAPASPAVYGSSFDLQASASSGLTVSFAADGVCTLSGNTVTMTSGTGDCTVTASQTGNENYNPAVSVEHTVQATKADQTIEFPAPASPAVYGSSFDLQASASSGLAVSFAVDGVCTSSGNTVTMTSGTGSCSVTASQGGDDNYNSAASVEHTVQAAKADQMIAFPAPASPAVYGSSFDLDASASSGLAVSFAVDGVCTLSGDTVTMTSGTGSCTVTASQTGNENYNPAVSVEHTVQAAKADQTIEFPAPASPAVYGSSFDLDASASSGLTVSFAVEGVCTLSGNTVSMTSGTGSCTVTASQGGDNNYNPATSVEYLVQAERAGQSIDFPQPASPVKYQTSFSVSPASTSGLPVSLSASGSCTNDGFTVTMTQTSGVCLLMAFQEGSLDYLPAESVQHSVEPAPNGNVLYIPLVFGQ